MNLIKNCLRNRLTELSLSNLMKIVIESPENSLIVIWKKLLMCGIEKPDGLQCKLSFRLLSHYICILSLLMLFVKHLSTSIMNCNNTISTRMGGGGGVCPPNENSVNAPKIIGLFTSPFYLSLQWNFKSACTHTHIYHTLLSHIDFLKPIQVIQSEDSKDSR